MIEMRELTKDEHGQMSKAFDRLLEITTDIMLRERGDSIFEDWACNLLYAKNEDTSLGDHMHLACMDTADRYAEAVSRACNRTRVEKERARLSCRAHIFRAGTRLVALSTGLVRDADIADCIGEIETAVSGASEALISSE
jgi:hypothetical protein